MPHKYGTKGGFYFLGHKADLILHVDQMKTALIFCWVFIMEDGKMSLSRDVHPSL